MNTAIVFGASGFIGSKLVLRLVESNFKVVAFTRSKDNIPSRNDKITVKNYSELDSLNALKGGTGIFCFNLSWQGVTGLERANYSVQLKNIERHLSLLEKMQDIGAECFIGASSISETEAAVYMGQDSIMPSGRLIYAIAKLTMNYMSKVVAAKGNMRYVNVKIANLFGKGGSDKQILPDTIIKRLKKEKTAFTSGAQWYDFLHVTDACSGLIALSAKGKHNNSYYLGSGQPRRLKEYLQIIERKIASPMPMGFGLIRSDDDGLPPEVFSTQKTKADTGFVPKISFEAGIDELISYYTSNQGQF